MDNVNNRGIGALVRHPYADKTGTVVSVTDEEKPVARVEFRHDSGVVTHGDFSLQLLESRQTPREQVANTFKVDDTIIGSSMTTPEAQ